MYLQQFIYTYFTLQIYVFLLIYKYVYTDFFDFFYCAHRKTIQQSYLVIITKSLVLIHSQTKFIINPYF